MCMPSFIFIGCCVSELHGRLCPYSVTYGLRLFIVVFQELHCLPNCLSIELDVAITSSSFVARYFLVSEIAKCTP